MRVTLAWLALLACAPLSFAQVRSQLQDHALLPLFAGLAPGEEPGMERHDIGEFGSCGFFSARGARWQQQFGDGSKLEVRCERGAGGFLPGFHVWFTEAGGARLEVARCVFGDGLNQGWFYTERNAAGRPAHLAKVVWATLDAGPNDGGNRHLTRDQRTGAAEPYADATVWVFDAAARTLDYSTDKFEYLAAATASGKPKLPLGSNAMDGFLGPRLPALSTSFRKVFAPVAPGKDGL